MLYLTTQGSPRERGRQHGHALAENAIPRALELSTWGQERPAQWYEYADAMWAFLSDNFPELTEEIEGIAEGADLELAVAQHLSFFNALAPICSACTNLGFTASDRGSLLGKTSDIGDDREIYLLQRVEPDSGYRAFRVSWAGNIWAETGINERGLAVGASSSPAIPGQDGYGMPQHIMMNPVLAQCATVEDALSLMTETNFAGKGQIFALVDEGGNASVVEKAGDRQGIIEPERNVFCNSNHYVTDALKEFQRDPSQTVSSRERLRWMRETFIEADPQPELSFEALMGALRHEEGDGRLCRKGHLGGHSHYGYLYVCRDRALHLSDGYPCENEFIEHRL